MDNLEFIANVSEVKIMKMHKNIRVTLEVPAGKCSSLLAGQLQAHGYDETHFKVFLKPMDDKDIKEAQEEIKEKENKPKSTDNSKRWSSLIKVYSRESGIPIEKIHEMERNKHQYEHFRDLEEYEQKHFIALMMQMIDHIDIPYSPEYS